MDKRIIFSLAIAASLLNSGFPVKAADCGVNAAEFSVKAADSDIKVSVSVEGKKKGEVDQATVEKLRKVFEEAKAALVKAESRRDTIIMIKKYCVGLTNGLLVSGGIIAPLARIVSDMHDFFIVAKKDLDLENCAKPIMIGILIQMNAILLMELTGKLSRFIDDYASTEYYKASDAKWNAEHEYNKAIQE